MPFERAVMGSRYSKISLNRARSAAEADRTTDAGVANRTGATAAGATRAERQSSHGKKSNETGLAGDSAMVADPAGKARAGTIETERRGS